MPSFSELFMDGVLRHCAVPTMSPEELEAWLDDFARILGVYPPDVLERARDRLIGEAGRGFILLSLPRCKAVCEEVHFLLHKPVVSRASDRFTGPSPEQLATARALIQGDEGRRAVADGWIVGLYDFALANSRLPMPDEAAGIKAKSLAITSSLARGSGPVAAARRAIEAKAARLSNVVSQAQEAA